MLLLLYLQLLPLLYFFGTVDSFSIHNQTPSSSAATSQESQVAAPPPRRFPNPSTVPEEVLSAHLSALREGDLETVYHLFSRARKLEIDSAARKDTRESQPSPLRRQQALVAFLHDRQSESLLSASLLPQLLLPNNWEEEESACDARRLQQPRNNDNSYQILSLLGDPNPPRGRLLTRLARIKANAGYYVVTLTRQSDWDGKGDPRDCDGYERCWFVWDIRREESDGGGDDDNPLPQSRLARRLTMVA